MAADEKEPFLFSQWYQLVANRLFYTAAVDDDGARLEKVGVLSHIIYGIAWVKSHDNDIALSQKLVVQGLFDGVYQHGFFDYLIGYVISVYSVVGILTYGFGQGASDETQARYPYLHGDHLSSVGVRPYLLDGPHNVRESLGRQ